MSLDRNAAPWTGHGHPQQPSHEAFHHQLQNWSLYEEPQQPHTPHYPPPEAWPVSSGGHPGRPGSSQGGPPSPASHHRMMAQQGGALLCLSTGSCRHLRHVSLHDSKTEPGSAITHCSTLDFRLRVAASRACAHSAEPVSCLHTSARADLVLPCHTDFRRQAVARARRQPTQPWLGRPGHPRLGRLPRAMVWAQQRQQGGRHDGQGSRQGAAGASPDCWSHLAARACQTASRERICRQEQHVRMLLGSQSHSSSGGRAAGPDVQRAVSALTAARPSFRDSPHSAARSFEACLRLTPSHSTQAHRQRLCRAWTGAGAMCAGPGTARTSG